MPKKHTNEIPASEEIKDEQNIVQDSVAQKSNKNSNENNINDGTSAANLENLVGEVEDNKRSDDDSDNGHKKSFAPILKDESKKPSNISYQTASEWFSAYLKENKTAPFIPDQLVVETFAAILKEYGSEKVIDSDFQLVYTKLKKRINYKFNKSELKGAVDFLYNSKQIMIKRGKTVSGSTEGSPKKTVEGRIPLFVPSGNERYINTTSLTKIAGYVRHNNDGYYLEPLGGQRDKSIRFISTKDAEENVDKLVFVNLYDYSDHYKANIERTLEGRELTKMMRAYGIDPLPQEKDGQEPKMSKIIAAVLGLVYSYDIKIDPEPKTLAAMQKELDQTPDKVTEDDPNDKLSIKNMKARFSNFFDARHLPFVTIDPKTCKDMDDAVCVIKRPDGGYTEYVAISLVSVYVKAFGEIFKDAFDRGNSSYFADMVAPMLRPILSNIIGSLNAGEDRLSFITKIEYDQDGNILSETMSPGVIKSRHKFAYETVDQIMQNDLAERSRYPEEILKSLDALKELENIVRPIREANGSTKFATTEPTYRLTKDRTAIESVNYDNSTLAHLSIESAMLTANQVLARFAQANNIPIIYRVEPQISEEKIDQIAAFLDKMGIPFNFNGNTASFGDLQIAINEAIEEASKKDKVFAQVVSEGIIKCLPKARYDVENEGHFALNFDAYAHTTSPIRRFADLVTQMQVLAFMEGKPLPFTKAQLAEICEHINFTERNSDDLERDTQELLNAFYVKQLLDQGKDLTEIGYISKVERDRVTVTTSYGHAVIELENSEKTGTFIPSPDRLTITNNKTKRYYSVGQSINIKPVDIDPAKFTIKAVPVYSKGVEDRSSQFSQEINTFYKTKKIKNILNNFSENVKDIKDKPFFNKLKKFTESVIKSFNRPVTIHEHTLKSDGSYSLLALLQWAARNDYAYVGPADHNYIALERLKELFGIKPEDMAKAYIPIDMSNFGKGLEGKVINYINSCEFTAYDTKHLNKNGKPTKYHLLVVAPKLDKPCEFLDLLALKRQNDIDADLARIEYLCRYSGVKFPSEELNKFRESKQFSGSSIKTLTYDFAKEFFDTHPAIAEQICPSREALYKMLRLVPDVKKFDVPIDILVEAAHACGALVLVAHPSENLANTSEKAATIRSFLEMGIDGFNIKEKEKRSTSRAIKYYCANTDTPNNIILDAGGHDCHSLEDYKNADHKKFTVGSCRDFISELEKLQKAREQGLVTHRIYKETDHQKLQSFIEEARMSYAKDYYAEFEKGADEIMEIEVLKKRFSAARDKSARDFYYTKDFLPSIMNSTSAPIFDEFPSPASSANIKHYRDSSRPPIDPEIDKSKEFLNQNLGKDVESADFYLTNQVIPSLIDSDISPEVIAYMKSQRSMHIKDIYAILKGTFVVPESKPSKKSAKRRMVSKEDNGHQINDNGKSK